MSAGHRHVSCRRLQALVRRAVIGEVVEEKLREILNDPDAGLTLRPEIRERLRRDLQEPQEEGQNIPAAELARRRGLDW